MLRYDPDALAAAYVGATFTDVANQRAAAAQNPPATSDPRADWIALFSPQPDAETETETEPHTDAERAAELVAAAEALAATTGEIEGPRRPAPDLSQGSGRVESVMIPDDPAETFGQLVADALYHSREARGWGG